MKPYAIAVPLLAALLAGVPPLFKGHAAVKSAPAPVSVESQELPDPAIEAMKKQAPAKFRAPRYSAEPAPVVPTIRLDDIAVVVGDIFEIEAASNCKAVKYLIIDDDHCVSKIPDRWVNQDIAQTAALCLATHVGQCRVCVSGSLNDVQADPILATITVTAQNPQPPPGPGPGPQPPPTPPPGPPTPPPQTANLSIISIDNAAGRNIPTSQFIGNSAYWAAVKAAGHSYWLIDSNNAAQSKNYQAQINAAGGIPVIIILDANRKILDTVQYPKDATGKPAPSVDWLNSVIAKNGGKPVGK